MLWAVVNDCMQMMGGIAYTNVYPIERFLRDARLQMIWTGTNEVMNLLIQHEYYKELLESKDKVRDVELDALDEEGEEDEETLVKPDACPNHSDREPADVCEECLKPFCEECLISTPDQTICKDCAKTSEN